LVTETGKGAKEKPARDSGAKKSLVGRQGARRKGKCDK